MTTKHETYNPAAAAAEAIARCNAMAADIAAEEAERRHQRAVARGEAIAASKRKTAAARAARIADRRGVTES